MFLCVLRVLCVGSVISACGKSGSPLPPIVRIPAAPAEFAAARRGDSVELTFTVPSANTDGTRPANVERVEVFAYTGSAEVRNEQIVKLATRVGQVAVKRPRDPNATIEPEEPASDMEPTIGTGLEQGAKARLREQLGSATLVPLATRSKKPQAPPVPSNASGALLPPAPLVVSRTYVSSPVSLNGRRGPWSPRIEVPLAPPPPPPESPTVTYTETTITVSWSPPSAASTLAPPAADALPAKLLWSTAPTLTYTVYDVTPTGAQTDGAKAPVETRLTQDPVSGTTYSDTRVTWGAERCYAIRTVEAVGSASIESDAVPSTCVTLVDTFPPAAPKELKSVAGEGVINLIWQPNDEKDLAGYIVLRGPSADQLQPITAAPVKETTFPDKVAAGTRYVYAVKAVDKAGNASAPSNTIEETAR